MKKKALRAVVTTAIFLIIIIGFVIINDQIEDNKRSSFIPERDSRNYAYQVENANVVGDELVIKGFFFENKKVQNKERNVENEDYEIVLYDIQSEKEVDLDGNSKPYKGISLNVSKVARNDVNSYFELGYDYSNSGFIARVNINELDIENKEYQVIFKVGKNNERGVMSSSYLYKGKLLHISSDNFVELDVKNTDLEDIVLNGTCLANIPQKKMTIIQYGWNIYWICDKTEYISDKSKMFMTNGFDTTQFDKLPQNDLADSRYWSYKRWCFEDNEITDTMNCGSYRVSVQSLPNDFSVYWIFERCEFDNMNVYEIYYRPVYNSNSNYFIE